jgi:hypothetical protein
MKDLVIPGILCQSKEFGAIKVNNKEEYENLMEMRKENIEWEKAYPTKTSEHVPKIQLKPILLLLGHMHGCLANYDLIGEQNLKDLEMILRAVPHYLDIMLMITMWLLQAGKMGQSKKKITCKNILGLIQYSKNLMQGALINKDPFHQLPHYGP